jgi:hypothetical protein
VDTLKIPFSFVDGSAEVHTDGSDEYFAHLLFCFASTQQNEIVLRPNVGIGDITYSQEAIETLAYSVAQYVPEIDVAEITAKTNTTGQTDIKISFLKRD